MAKLGRIPKKKKIEAIGNVNPTQSVSNSLPQIVPNFQSVQPRVVEASIDFLPKPPRRSEGLADSKRLGWNVNRCRVQETISKDRGVKLQLGINKLSTLKRANDVTLARIERHKRETQVLLDNCVSHLM